MKDDQEIIRRIIKGDREAFAMIIQKIPNLASQLRWPDG